MNRRRSKLSSQKGFVLVYMAATLTGSLLFTGLAVDSGRAYVVKAQLTKAVDGAALAGARSLNSGNPRREAEKIFPELVEYAGERDVRIIIENCVMEGWHPDGYPGNLAYSPELWEWMFDLGLYLNFDPSHLLWLGIDEPPKIALIIAGTVFYNILMIADVARGVPRELIATSYTLGAGRTRVLRRVVFPHAWPGIIDVARINLAAAWLMLVVAELLAAQDGLAYRLVQSQRGRQVDRMFAILIIFGLIGVVSDLALRGLRNRTAPWARA